MRRQGIMSFAEYLKHIREEKGLSQIELAEALDTSIGGIKAVETGVTKYPTEKMTAALASFLNESPLKIVTDILYGEVQEENKMLYTYMAFKYLEGWRIEKLDFSCCLWEGYSLPLDGCVIKKRDPKNIAFVFLFEQHCKERKNIKNKEEALDYIGWLISRLMVIKDSYRSVQIVFNKDNCDEVKAYRFIEELDIRKVPFQLDVVLFEYETGEIEKKIYK